MCRTNDPFHTGVVLLVEDGSRLGGRAECLTVEVVELAEHGLLAAPHPSPSPGDGVKDPCRQRVGRGVSIPTRLRAVVRAATVAMGGAP